MNPIKKVVYGDPDIDGIQANETFDAWCERIGDKATALGADIFFPYGQPPKDEEDETEQKP